MEKGTGLGLTLQRKGLSTKGSGRTIRSMGRGGISTIRLVNVTLEIGKENQFFIKKKQRKFFIRFFELKFFFIVL